MKKKRFNEFNLQSSENRFDWILQEAARARREAQSDMRNGWRTRWEQEMSRLRPIWKSVDDSLKETDHGARNGRLWRNGK